MRVQSDRDGATDAPDAATFASDEEIRRLGGPVVRLFRAGLGRDPAPRELREFVQSLRRGGGLDEAGALLAASTEFQRVNGAGGLADEAFIDGVLRRIHGSAAPRPVATAGLGAGRGEATAILAQSAAARERLPLLPGVCPGAGPDDTVAYRLWVEEYDSPSEAALARIQAPAGPLVSVAMAAGDTNAEAALRTVQSLRRQTYANWELCLAPRLLSAWPRAALETAAGEEPRVRLLTLPEGAARDADLQFALASGSGPFVCLLDAGDRLATTALQEVVDAFDERIGIVFTDEDVMAGAAAERRHPWFKPGYSADAMLAGNAIGQLAVYRAELAAQAGGLRADEAPFASYGLALRATALAGAGGVKHVPAVLCHRAARPRDWPGPAEAPRREADRLTGMEAGRFPRARFAPAPAPLASVIVPTRDHAALLQACAEGVLERTDYPKIELLIVDNGSTEPEALALLSRLRTDARVRVLRQDGAFNFAALNNAAAAAARGEVLVLLNNDIEVLAGDWLRELASHALRPGVGAVGAKLLYPDRTVQHAGILLGPDGAATHVGRGAAADDPGYAGQLACARDVSAVTAACLAMRKSVFEDVGGMDERFAVTWNDVDLCLRVRAAGLRVIWTPHASLMHREGVTRGLESADAGRRMRFEREKALAGEVWGRAVERDPFLNANLLASEAGPLVLTRPRRRRPWQAREAPMPRPTQLGPTQLGPTQLGPSPP